MTSAWTAESSSARLFMSILMSWRTSTVPAPARHSTTAPSVSTMWRNAQSLQLLRVSSQGREEMHICVKYARYAQNMKIIKCVKHEWLLFYVNQQDKLLWQPLCHLSPDFLKLEVRGAMQKWLCSASGSGLSVVKATCCRLSSAISMNHVGLGEIGKFLED